MVRQIPQRQDCQQHLSMASRNILDLTRCVLFRVSTPDVDKPVNAALFAIPPSTVLAPVKIAANSPLALTYASVAVDLGSVGGD